MNQRAIIVGTALFILITASMFGYAYMKRVELARAPIVVPELPVATTTDDVRINAVHFFKDGAHVVVGDVMVPTPCDLLESGVIVAESMPEQVNIKLTTLNNADTCAQVLTLQRFRVDFTASEKATIQATLNGKSVILNLRDAEPGTDPLKLEDLYFKG
ncbi:MAG: hypothetical protein RLZZ234_834 [Candidatus Parcubacteria bacterium]